MKEYRYLIIGGGMTAAAALKGIREVDTQGSIGLLTADTHPPYARPPLSKALWKGQTTVEKIMSKIPDGVDVHVGCTAQTLDVAAKQVTDSGGETYTYEKLLLATGGTPRRLPFGGDDIIYYRTLDDYRRLRDLAEQQQKFVIIGGGFIGSEVAAALAMQGKSVTMVFPDAGVAAAPFPPR